MSMRRFRLMRDEDVSGVSGVGLVAEGVQFSSGKAALSWCSQYGTVAVFDSVDDIETIHGHEGRTRIEWLDPELEEGVEGNGSEARGGAPAQADGERLPQSSQPEVAHWVLEDLAARRRAGASDSELLSLLEQPDRGGLDRQQAAEVLDNLDQLLAG